MKLVLWGAIGLALAWWWLRARKGLPRPESGAPASAGRRKDDGEDDSAETMLRCAHCGVHIPASEAIAGRADTVFCSEEHLRRHFPG